MSVNTTEKEMSTLASSLCDYSVFLPAFVFSCLGASSKRGGGAAHWIVFVLIHVRGVIPLRTIFKPSMMLLLLRILKSSYLLLEAVL
jgi:hypothetical protein